MGTFSEIRKNSLKITKSLGTVFAVAFMLVGCGTDVPGATTIDYVFDENGVLTVEHGDGGIPEGPVIIRVRDANGDTYTVNGSDMDDATAKLAERAARLSDGLWADIADRPLLPPEVLGAFSPEERAELNVAVETAMRALDALPTDEELIGMSPDERAAAADRAQATLKRAQEEIMSGRGK